MGRSGVADVRTAIAETEIAVCLEDDSELVAADRRGAGLGDTLMRAVVDHPALQSVDGLSLLCREGLVPYYESVGFALYESEVEIPEGGVEKLVRMVYVLNG